VLAEAPAELEAERLHALRVELAGALVRVHLDQASDGAAAPLLTGEDVSPAGAGRFGVRVVGEGVHLADVVLTPAGDAGPLAPVRVAADDPGPPELRALESLCLALVNLNEFLYVD
jgi:hypothetical protein